MIIYSSTAMDFKTTVDNNKIASEIERAFIEKMNKKPNVGEIRSWNNSMQFMERVVRLSGIANDCGIMIEFNIPSTSKRVDFIITGKDDTDSDNYVVVELKQWDSAEATEKEDVVRSFVGGGVREVTHPSYQAWSYRQFIQDMNEAVYSNEITGYSCAYLHNYKGSEPEPLKGVQYNKYLDEAPLFFSEDSVSCRSF